MLSKILIIIFIISVSACSSEPFPTEIVEESTSIPLPSPTPKPTNTTPPTDMPLPTDTNPPTVSLTPTITNTPLPSVNTETTTDIVYAKVNVFTTKLDVYAPVEPGPWPVVVIVHGGQENRSNYAPLAKAIASTGVVVYNIDSYFTHPWIDGIEGIACAVRYSRATAADYGGNPERIILIGSSAGAATGAVVALAGDDFEGDCVTKDVSALPSAFIAYEGPYDFATTDDVLFNYSQLKEQDPELWEAINPYSHIGRNPELQVRLVHGNDTDNNWFDVRLDVSKEFHQALEEAGHDVELIIVKAANHSDLNIPSSDAFSEIIQQVMELVSH